MSRQETALAASQPVSETDAYQQGFRDGQDRTCTVVARQPVGEPVCADCGTQVLFECTGCSRSNYPTYMQGAIGEIVYSGEGGLQIEFYDGKPLAPMKLYAAPPAQAVDLGAVRQALQAAEGLATICASVDGYSREEVAASGRAMKQQFADALAKVDSQAVGK